MNVLFVSGVSVGGAIRSTKELAAYVSRAGHRVTLLQRSNGGPARNWLYTKQINAYTKAARREMSVARPLDDWARRTGRRRRTVSSAWEFAIIETVVLENALPYVLDEIRPDVVVANSVSRVAWRRLHELIRARRLPIALYLREEEALGHLKQTGFRPDILLANSEAIAEAAGSLGYSCTFVPSVIDVSSFRVASTRQAVLYVNPEPTRGLDIAIGVATARQDVPFVFQQSWPMSPSAMRALTTQLSPLANVELREIERNPERVYRDARVLFTPYLVGNRPRVVLEAQANGVPVLASDWPGFQECVGPGGRLVSATAPLERWLEALAALWDDAEAYRVASDAALRHSKRPSVQPVAVAHAFVSALNRGLHPMSVQ